MAYTSFDFELRDKIAHIRFNRPDKRNCMIPEFWRELPEVVNQLHEGGVARALIISSTGPHFTGGLDLGIFTSGSLATAPPGEVGRARGNLRLNVMHLQEAFSCLERARMPVLAAIQGGCIGGGVDLVSACDMRYCTQDAFFCIQEINIGITADVGTLQRLPKIIPEGIVRELAYTGRRLPADRAREIGLVNEVFPTQDQMLASVSVMHVAREIAAHSPLAVWGSKEMLNYSRDHTVADSLNFVATWQTGMFQPTDLGEVFQARQEKRDPEFEDLPPLRKGL
jgi:enoyl-CoA hydratase